MPQFHRGYLRLLHSFFFSLSLSLFSSASFNELIHSSSFFLYHCPLYIRMLPYCDPQLSITTIFSCSLALVYPYCLLQSFQPVKQSWKNWALKPRKLDDSKGVLKIYSAPWRWFFFSFPFFFGHYFLCLKVSIPLPSLPCLLLCAYACLLICAYACLRESPTGMGRRVGINGLSLYLCISFFLSFRSVIFSLIFANSFFFSPSFYFNQ